MPIKERVQKIIAAAGMASRREAERWIEAGRVKVNGAVVSLGATADRTKDKISVDDRHVKLSKASFTYLMVNKPFGYVTTMKDPEGRPTVVELVKKQGKRLLPVGRLDLNSEGLILMTDDGEFINRMTHPRYKVPKTYLARVRGVISSQAIEQLQNGVILDDGPTQPAQISDVKPGDKNSWLQITISEGRNRQVRRMCEAVGYPVVRLKRIAVGSLLLEKLRSGKSRELDPKEVSRLLSEGET